MAAIRSRDTKPELLVRRALHAAGYRFRVGKRVEGFRPDVVFTGRRKAVFVHGCFWHGHEACGCNRVPKTRVDYWTAKISGNRARDSRAETALADAGWKTLTVWECELRAGVDFARLADFLGAPRRAPAGPAADH